MYPDCRDKGRRYENNILSHELQGISLELQRCLKNAADGEH